MTLNLITLQVLINQTMIAVKFRKYSHGKQSTAVPSFDEAINDVTRYLKAQSTTRLAVTSYQRTHLHSNAERHTSELAQTCATYNMRRNTHQQLVYWLFLTVWMCI